jgi:hypothetical protein
VVQLDCALAEKAVARVNASAIAMTLATGHPLPFHTLADDVAELRKKWGAVGRHDRVLHQSINGLGVRAVWAIGGQYRTCCSHAIRLVEAEKTGP